MFKAIHCLKTKKNKIFCSTSYKNHLSFKVTNIVRNIWIFFRSLRVKWIMTTNPENDFSVKSQEELSENWRRISWREHWKSLKIIYEEILVVILVEAHGLILKNSQRIFLMSSLEEALKDYIIGMNKISIFSLVKWYLKFTNITYLQRY